MSDLPLLELSIYYNFRNIYNGYYSWAIDHPETKAKAPTSAQTTVTADAQPFQCFFGNLIEWFSLGLRLLALGDETIAKTSIPGPLAPVVKDQPTSLEKFENFRQAYGKLETVLFIHLSYYMGLFVKANLNPLPIKFPRVNKIFLKTLIDYHILETTKYPGNFEDHSRASGFIEHSKNLFARKRKKKIEQTQSESDKSEQSIKAAKERIDEWEMSARLLRDVFNEIYTDENVEKFYKMSQDDFEKKLLVVEQKVKDLDPIAKKYFEKEEPSSQKQTTTLADFLKP